MRDDDGLVLRGLQKYDRRARCDERNESPRELPAVTATGDRRDGPGRHGAQAALAAPPARPSAADSVADCAAPGRARSGELLRGGRHSPKHVAAQGGATAGSRGSDGLLSSLSECGTRPAIRMGHLMAASAPDPRAQPERKAAAAARSSCASPHWKTLG